jgi:hypothetical protein
VKRNTWDEIRMSKSMQLMHAPTGLPDGSNSKIVWFIIIRIWLVW